MKKNYGEKVVYSINEIIQFPDFSLVYKGERSRNVYKYNNQFITIYDFEITTSNEKEKVSWAHGTGKIKPKYFEVDDLIFALEKEESKKLGELLENEIVIYQIEAKELEVQ